MPRADRRLRGFDLTRHFLRGNEMMAVVRTARLLHFLAAVLWVPHSQQHLDAEPCHTVPVLF